MQLDRHSMGTGVKMVTAFLFMLSAWQIILLDFDPVEDMPLVCIALQTAGRC